MQLDLILYILNREEREEMGQEEKFFTQTIGMTVEVRERVSRDTVKAPHSPVSTPFHFLIDQGKSQHAHQ